MRSVVIKYIMYPPPPRPLQNGRVTPKQSVVATAASTALPLLFVSWNIMVQIFYLLSSANLFQLLNIVQHLKQQQRSLRLWDVYLIKAISNVQDNKHDSQE